MGAHAARLLGLARRTGERGDVAAPLVEELQCHVAESADADHTHAIGGPHVVLYQRIENGDPAAKQGTGYRGVQRWRDGSGPTPVTTHASGERALSAPQASRPTAGP